MIGINNLYEKKLEQFIYKDEPVALFEFECSQYVNILTDKIVPLLAQYLEQHPEDSIDSYLSFVNYKYQENFKNDIYTWKKRELNVLKENSKKMIKELSLELLTHINKNSNEKNQYIINFTEKYEKQLIEMCWHDIELFIQTVAQLSNPKLQYIILNVLSKDIFEQSCEYFSKISEENLNKILERYVCYPLDIKMDEYGSKWIGKEKIYVKFLNKILGNRYDYAKNLLKKSQKNKTTKTIINTV